MIHELKYKEDGKYTVSWFMSQKMLAHKQRKSQVNL